MDARSRPPNAVALTKGAVIGGSAYFANRGLMFSDNSGGSFGYFVDKLRTFVGVRFLIDGAVHYGWIGFRSVNPPGGYVLVARLGGWAYETEPNTPIVAGDIGGTADAEEAAMTAAPSSLALLAAGDVALVDWRRRRVG